jgi:L-fuconate dehydratase
VIEYVDHLHEHFVSPVVMRNDRYMPPEDPGYSAEMKPDSLVRYRFPAAQHNRFTNLDPAAPGP